MKIVVIGGTGHIGTFLCPMLVDMGHEVICITRGQKAPYQDSESWGEVEMVTMDRAGMSEKEFAEAVANLEAEVVIDLIGFTLDDAKAMVSALDGKVDHYLFTSSCWAEGRAEILPFDTENTDKEPLCEYGEQKYACEQYLLDQYSTNDFPVTIIMPGQISGGEWDIVNPWGNRLVRCLQIIKDGEEIALPNFGMETIHHVNGKDVARLFACAVSHRSEAIGEKFYAASGGSVTLYGYAKLLYRHWNHEPKIKFLPWPEWQDYVRKECADAPDVESQINDSYLHIARSGYLDPSKGTRMLGYIPEFTNVETILMAMDGYESRGELK